MQEHTIVATPFLMIFIPRYSLISSNVNGICSHIINSHFWKPMPEGRGRKERLPLQGNRFLVLSVVQCATLFAADVRVFTAADRRYES